MTDASCCLRELCCKRVARQEERYGGLQWVHCLDCGAARMLSKVLNSTDLEAAVQHACSPVAVQPIDRAVVDRIKAPRRVLADFRAGLNAPDASAPIGSTVFRYTVVPFACIDL